MNYSVNTDLLIKYFSGLASPEEALHIDEWRKKDAGNETRFQELLHSWMEEQDYKIPDLSILWNDLEHKTSAKNTIKRKSKVLKWLPYAAILIVLLGIGLWNTQRFHDKDKRVQSFNYTNVEDSFQLLRQGVHVHLLSEGTVLEEYSNDSSGVFFELTGNAVIRIDNEISPKPGLLIRLPSGIWLKDIGTKFLVESGKTSAKIIVYEGIVMAWNKKDSVQIGKNEILMYTSSGFTKSDLTGDFDYRDYSLKQVCDLVGAYFNTVIEVEDQALADRMITLTGKNLNFKQVLDIISSTLEIRYATTTKDTVIFKTN